MAKKPILPLVTGFKGLLSIQDRITAATPPAKLEYLRGVNMFVHHVATNPFAVQALAFNVANHNNSENVWHFGQVVNMATRSGRACIGRSVTQGSEGAISNAETTSVGSGSGSNDVIVIACESIEQGTDAYPISFTRGIDVASKGYNASPSTPQDRQYEIAEALAPALEKFTLNRGHSWGMIVYPSNDMSGL